MQKRLLTVLAGAALLACGGTPSTTSSTPPSPDSVTGTINVFAAASLTAAFKDEGSAFQVKHPNAAVTFNFAGSASLVTSINNGAPADVFASADTPNMDKVMKAGNVTGEAANFATNKLQIVIPAGNPKGIKGLADLANPSTVVILCAPTVPCGNYANQALTKAGVKVTAKSQEQDVNAVVSKVSLGEADAGIVYLTDVKAAGAKVQGVDIPDEQNVVAVYPIATVKGGSNPTGGYAFIDFVLSSPGQAILANYGFSKV
jgi:molybdate transport system substrate-binding protein